MGGSTSRDLPCVARHLDMAAPSLYSNKEIARHYFAPTDIPDTYQCVCGQVRKQAAKSGYGNLVSHVKTYHKDYEEQIQCKLRAGAGSILSFVDDKSRNIFCWIEWIVEGNIFCELLSFLFKKNTFPSCVDNLTLNFVKKPNTRKNVRLKTICTKSLKKYMHLLTKALEEKISRILPDKFGQVFDGWSNAGVHYIATFATFDGQPENKPILLAFSPVDDEQDLTAMSLYYFLVDTNDFYGKTIDNLLFIVSDNCKTNQAIAKHTTLPFIGCASHRFNLAVQQYLEEHEELLRKIHELMKKFSTIKGRAYLHTFTHLEPRLRQDTRWSSTFTMVLRYVRFIPLFGKFQTADITRLGILPLMLSPADNAR